MVNPKMMGEIASLKKSGKFKNYFAKENIFQHRYMMHIASGEGLADFALSEKNLNWKKIITRLDSHGIKFTAPIDWNIGTSQTNALPFLIKDITAQSLRNNAGAGQNKQKNIGATGIAGITIAVKNLSERVKQSDSLGSPLCVPK